MFFAFFHQNVKKVARGKLGGQSPFGHRFGGRADYAGLQAFPRQPPVHLLFRLNTADPLVGISLPKTEWLPLLCAIRYGACGLGYRVISDDKVKILHQDEKKAWRGFPRAGFSKTLPAKPLHLSEVPYDPADPKEALLYEGVFGFDALTKKQFAKLVRYVKDEGIHHLWGWETVEDYLREGGSAGPLCKGVPKMAVLTGLADCTKKRKRYVLSPFSRRTTVPQKSYGGQVAKIHKSSGRFAQLAVRFLQRTSVLEASRCLVTSEIADASGLSHK